MGKENKGIRDGSGPFKESFQAKKSSEGKRQEAGEECIESNKE